MSEEFSQIVKIRYNKTSGDFSVNIPAEFRGMVSLNKYMECRKDPVTGGLLYTPLSKVV